MIGKHPGSKAPKGNAALEVEKKTKARMEATGRWIYGDAQAAILAEDENLAERFYAETRKGLMPDDGRTRVRHEGQGADALDRQNLQRGVERRPELGRRAKEKMGR